MQTNRRLANKDNHLSLVQLMRILCLQHVPFEGPAAIADWATSRGHKIDCHHVYTDAHLPSLNTFDFLLVMGGPMNIYQYEQYPWLIEEKRFIKACIDSGKYVVGICLGGQLIADVLGGSVSRGESAEIGWFPIRRSADCPQRFELPAELPVLHWHGDRFDIPKGAIRIASSEACQNQGFLYANRVLGWQCHLETTPQSLKALVDACGDELVDGPFIMPADQLLAEPENTFQSMQSVLFKLLDELAAPVDIIDWGLTKYTEAFEQQKAQVERRRAGEVHDALIFTEHEPVYTMGLRKGAQDHLVWSPAQCEALGIEVFQSNRGGDITYHGPGQIVGYPVVSLQHQKDLHAYLRDIEEVVIRSLAAFGLKSARREGKTGIWIDDQRKICAIGVAVRSWVTYHGFALNVSPDMDHFNGIVPCGITDGTVTSLADELDQAIDIENVKARLAVEFQRVFRNTAPQDDKP